MKLRQRKLSDRIRDILAQALSRAEIPDPDLSGAMITRVHVSPDLQIASVYFRLYTDGETEVAQEAFDRNKGLFRKMLASELIIRRVPELRFFYDDVQDKVDVVEDLLHKIREEDS